MFASDALGVTFCRLLAPLGSLFGAFSYLGRLCGPLGPTVVLTSVGFPYGLPDAALDCRMTPPQVAVHKTILNTFSVTFVSYAKDSSDYVHCSCVCTNQF